MGIIKYGPLAQEVAGTVGGVTFARTHTAKACRGWRPPTNKRTADQVTQRSILATVAQRWLRSLSSSQRAAWDTYAATCPFTNSLGETYYLNGYNMYVRNNGIHMAAIDDVRDNAPTTSGFPTAETLTLLWQYDNGILILDDWDPVPDVDACFYFCIHSIRPITWTFPYPYPIGRTNIPGAYSPPLNLYAYGVQSASDVGKLQVLTTWYFADETYRVSKEQTSFTTLTAPD